MNSSKFVLRFFLFILFLAPFRNCFASDSEVVISPTAPNIYTPLSTGESPSFKVPAALQQQDAVLQQSIQSHPAKMSGASNKTTPLRDLGVSPVQAVQKPRPPFHSSLAVTYITTCQAIMAPGNYVLRVDLTADSNCLSIHDTQNVTLSCAGHQITSTQSLDYTVKIENAQQVTLQGCDVTNSFSGALEVANSSHIQIQNNTLDAVTVTQSQQSEFTNNHISGYYQQNNSSYMTLSGNQVSGPKDQFSNAIVRSNNGSHNTIVGNTIDGGWDGTLESYGKTGADDGIGITSEDSDQILQNTISNDWDCGIEFTGTMTNTLVADNTLINNFRDAIASFYDTSWQNITIRNNNAQGSSLFFTANYEPGSSAIPSTIYFQNVTLDNNVYQSASTANNPGIAASIDFTNLPIQNAPSSVIAGNVQITNNDFGVNSFAPKLLPSGSLSNGSGNICLPSKSSPISCSATP